MEALFGLRPLHSKRVTKFVDADVRFVSSLVYDEMSRSPRPQSHPQQRSRFAPPCSASLAAAVRRLDRLCIWFAGSLSLPFLEQPCDPGGDYAGAEKNDGSRFGNRRCLRLEAETRIARTVRDT